jgi:KaiC/GvpD/RAD55 family RecA-like ATPase
MNRVKFGINGLDTALHGGIEKGSATLICGGPGTGKTSMGLHFVYSGAVNGERGMYVSLEERKDRIIQSTATLGMKKFKSFVKSGNIQLMGITDFEKTDGNSKIVEDVLKSAKKNKVKRIVVDTLTTLAVYATSPRWKVAATHPSPKLVLFQPSMANVKQFLVNFINAVNKIDSTLVFLSEDSDEYTQTQKYICDSVIEMERQSLEAAQEGSVLLRVLKTRRSSHSPSVHVVEIKSGRGVSVIPAAEALKV